MNSIDKAVLTALGMLMFSLLLMVYFNHTEKMACIKNPNADKIAACMKKGD